MGEKWRPRTEVQSCTVCKEKECRWNVDWRANGCGRYENISWCQGVCKKINVDPFFSKMKEARLKRDRRLKWEAENGIIRARMEELAECLKQAAWAIEDLAKYAPKLAEADEVTGNDTAPEAQADKTDP